VYYIGSAPAYFAAVARIMSGDAQFRVVLTT